MRCPRCSSPVGPEQDWCLECGAPARTRLAPTPNWQLPTVAIGAIVLLAGALLAFAFVKLTSDDDVPTAGTTPTAVVETTPPAIITPPPAVTTLDPNVDDRARPARSADERARPDDARRDHDARCDHPARRDHHARRHDHPRGDDDARGSHHAEHEDHPVATVRPIDPVTGSTRHSRATPAPASTPPGAPARAAPADGPPPRAPSGACAAPATSSVATTERDSAPSS